MVITCVWNAATQFYPVSTSEAEFREIEDTFLFLTFLKKFEPFTSGLCIKSLQLLVVDVKNSQSVK